MLLPEAVVIAVYAMVDEFQATHLPPVRRRGGQQPALTRSEVLTLALLGQLGCFASERALYRVVDTEWRHRFPRLPARVQLHATIRAQAAALVAFGRCRARPLDALTAEDEVLACPAVPLRTANRRGVGAMPAVVARGTAGRLGWFVGVRRLVATTPTGAITGLGDRPGHRAGARPWPTPSWPNGRPWSRPCPASAARPAGSTWPIPASRGGRRGHAGWRWTPTCSPRPSAAAPSAGPNRSAPSTAPSAGSWRPSSHGCTGRSGWSGTGRAPWAASWRGSRPRSRAPTPRSAATAARVAPAPPWRGWSGEPIPMPSRRFSPRALRASEISPLKGLSTGLASQSPA